MNLISYCDRLIRYAFYALFFLVPLVLASNTSELFELNKMWLTWGLTIVIIGAWVIKMIINRQFFVQRTILDIPILLFLLSQLLSTIFSLDTRVSLWGYYSRFNGGFLSLLAYTLLYYAFVSNPTYQEVKKFLKITLLSGIVVALWGFPSHFGYDPTCLLFRGQLDTSCWTESFKPTIRIFSTLGQPAWMAAYLAVLLPLTMAAWLNEQSKTHILPFLKSLLGWKSLSLLGVILLFYLDLLFTNTRGGFLAFWAANALFWGIIFFLEILPRRKFLLTFGLVNALFLLSNFFVGTPVAQLNKITLSSLTTAPAQQATTRNATQSAQPTTGVLDTGITDSGKIRLLVWDGAIDAWKANPILGTGVETFAFAYYKFRPAEHNMTSEWDYLYNKAHNEYLNYLTTTGALGLGTQILYLGFFLFLALRRIMYFRSHKDERPDIGTLFYLAAFPSAFVSIIISNFFGFSVVIMNIFLYFIPLWFLLLSHMIQEGKGYTISFQTSQKRPGLNPYQWTFITFVSIFSLFLLFQLIKFWQADTAYALGYNYDRAGAYDAAYPSLTAAVAARPTEPVFKDELSLNLATLATALMQSNNATTGAQLADQALALSNEVTNNHPNNVVFWKTRVRVYYLLSQIDPKYYKNALEGILRAQQLAPTDAKISYNVGVLYGQNGEYEKAVNALTETIKLKPNYRDAYYARALFARQRAESVSGNEKSEYQKRASDDLLFILKNINPTDEESRKTLESWGVQAP